MNLETPAFNRDPAFIGHPASVRTLASSPLRLLMSFVPMFPVYVNLTLHNVNSRRVYLFG